MPNRLTALLVLLLSLTMVPLISHAEVVKIGVLSGQNFRTTMKEWRSTATYLKQQLPQHVFQILPYSQQSDLVTDLEKNKLDFLLTKKHDLAQLMADFSLNPILNVEKNTAQWILAHSYNLPSTVAYSITDALLKLPANHPAKAGYPLWTLASNTEVQLSTQQQLKASYNQLMALALEMLNQYWALLFAALLSALQILLYRKWDRYHTRITEVKKHQQQHRDPSLSDTVF